MKKNLVLLLIIGILSTTIIPVNVFAETSKTSLNIPSNMPDPNKSLKEAYNGALDGLKKEGFGINNYKNGIGELKAPEGYGKNADEVFKEKYGDMWKDKTVNMEWASKGLEGKPSDAELKNYISNFASQYAESMKSQQKTGVANFEQIKSIPLASSKWSLPSYNQVANDPNYKVMSKAEAQSKIGALSCDGPAGWESVMNSKPKRITTAGVIENSLSDIKDSAGILWNDAKSLLPKGGQDFMNGVEDAWNKTVDVVSHPIDSAKSAWKTVSGACSEWWNGFAGNPKNWSNPFK